LFSKAVIHYPSDEQATAIYKELTAFQCAAVIRHIKSLNLDDGQIEALYASLAKDIPTNTVCRMIPNAIK